MSAMIQTQIQIADHSRLLQLDYLQLLVYHGGGALAGAALGFRAMQAAAAALSKETPWDRKELSVSSAHRGPGVMDALEFVTRCVTRGSFNTHSDDSLGNPCGSNAAFRFRVIDGRHRLDLALREGSIPAEFFAAVQASRAQPHSDQARVELANWKRKTADQIMSIAPEALYALNLKPC